jgi:hypothetical protein
MAKYLDGAFGKVGGVDDRRLDFLDHGVGDRRPGLRQPVPA